jgi:fibronectin type 3 domain-containing protein
MDSTGSTSYKVTGLLEETAYYFQIRSFDHILLLSEPLNCSNTTLDLTNPEPAWGLKFSAIGGTFLNLSWSASNSSDVKGYHIQINRTGSATNFEYLTTTSNRYINVTGLTEEIRYYFRIIAFDEVPLNSVWSNIVSAKTLDISPPAPPTSLTISSVGGTYISITWTGSISPDVQGYQVYVNDTGSSTTFHYIDSTINNNFNHAGLIEETKYYYEVRAYDEVPLYSIFSNTVSATTLDETSPAAPTGLVAKDPKGHEITLQWNPNTESDLAGYHIFKNNKGAAYPFYLEHTIIGTATEYTVSSLTEEITYYFVVTAYDEVPNTSPNSNIASATTLDISAPDPPVIIEGEALSGSQISLKWYPNTEADLEGYLIFINDTNKGVTGPYHIIHTIYGKDTGYGVTHLSSETQYHFRLKAFDEVPNNSSYSNTVSVTTLDVTKPSAPTELKVYNPTKNSLSISWKANPEPDVAGYNLYRSTSLSGSYNIINSELITKTTYQDTKLDEFTTYYYKVTALDDAELESEFSDTAYETTLLGPYKPGINNSIEDFSIDEDSYDDSSINLYHWFKDRNNDKLKFRYANANNIEVKIVQDNGTVVLKPKHNWNGQETITFYAADDTDEISEDVTITVTYVNDSPGIVDITKPSDDIEFTEGDEIDFTGSCDDPDLPYGDELIYKWKSNISGELGKGETLSDIILTKGNHLITLEVSDKAGEKAIYTIIVIVKAKANETPVNDLDDDGDGMPDAWEQKNGLDPLDPSDASTDKDGDRLSNLEEFQHGTDPNEADTDGDSYYDNVDKYPLDSTKWDDESGPDTTTSDEKETTWGLIGGIIVVIIIVIIVLFLLFIKPRLGGRINQVLKNPSRKIMVIKTIPFM